MKFRLYTLVDITETRARKGDDTKPLRQQQNFLTIIQTIGMRVNPAYIEPPVLCSDSTKKYGLGTSFKNKQTIWKFTFDIEYEDALSVDTLINDFDLVPIIDDLDESVKFSEAHFNTKSDSLRNICFEVVEYK
jgi:hypothetical protein